MEQLPTIRRKQDVSSSVLARSFRQSTLIDLGRGYFAQAPTAPKKWQRAEYLYHCQLQAVAARSTNVVFVGPTAAFLLGLPVRVDRVAIHVAATSYYTAHLPSWMDRSCGILHRTRSVKTHVGATPSVVVGHSGLPCASLADTCVWAARFAPAEEAFAVVNEALRRFVPEHLQRSSDALEACDCFRQELFALLRKFDGGRGIRQARQVIALADPRCESPAESRAFAAAIATGLPFELQVPVLASSGKRYFIDLAFPDARVGVEIDGQIKYDRGGEQTSGVLQAERQREREIEHLGYSIFRFCWSDLLHVEDVAQRMLRACGKPEVILGGNGLRLGRAISNQW